MINKLDSMLDHDDECELYGEIPNSLRNKRFLGVEDRLRLAELKDRREFYNKYKDLCETSKERRYTPWIDNDD